MATSEYKELTEAEKKDVRTHRNALGVAEDYCKPYFQKAVRFCRLFDGELPEELNSTFSKVMLNKAFSMIQNEIPRSTRIFTSTKYFKLRPLSMDMETYADETQKWLSYQMNNQQQIAKNIVAPIQSTHVCGNGYMVYGHRYKERAKTERVATENSMGIPGGFEDKRVVEGYDSIITGQFAHFFSILPQPGGANPNAVDDSSESVIDGAHWTHYMTEAKIKENVKKHGWNKNQVGWMTEKKGSDGLDPAQDYIGQLGDTTKGGMYGGDPKWINTAKDINKNMAHRYRTEWYFQRDRWIVMGEGQYLLWAGKPLIDAIPIANFRAMPIMNNWFGKSMIDISEDIIIAIMQNFNARLDYLAQTLHPTMWVSSRILDHHGGDKSVFDPKPYSVIDFPGGIENIQNAIFHDRYPDISQQAFMEESSLDKMFQETVGQPNFMRGMGTGGQADSSATGVATLSAEGATQSGMRAVNIENTGIMDCLWLTLKYGAKYVDENVSIRMEEQGGPPWTDIAHEAITDGYGIEVCGAKTLNVQEETFRKMLSMAQVLIGNPAVANQKLLMKEMMEASDSFDDVNAIIGQDEPGVPPQGAGEEAAGQGPIQNQDRSQQNRNTVEGGTGATVSAGSLLA